MISFDNHLREKTETVSAGEKNKGLRSNLGSSTWI